jgi:hypothetical protein
MDGVGMMVVDGGEVGVEVNMNGTWIKRQNIQ